MNIINKFRTVATNSKYLRSIQTVKFCTQDNFQPVALRPKKPKAKEPVNQFFVDHWYVTTIGGKGGDGCISFLRLFANSNAGPDGGDGGNGGHVIFKSSSDVSDLRHLKPKIMAPNGERGFNRDCNGKNALHKYIEVPVGTVIRNREGLIVGDLNEEGAMFIASRGGAGGRGNHFFASDTLQAPQVAEFGAEGEICKYVLEVKSMAHIGLIGMPNAGKSTLLRAISRARPKVASYAFTTLKPHIGIVQYNDYEQVSVADLPGLIEGSHKNDGLGIDFLKHAERCNGLLFVIDLSHDDPFWQYKTLQYEISQFSLELSKRPFAIIGNKLDLEKAQKNFQNFQTKVELPVIGISAKMGKNLAELLKKIRDMYNERSKTEEQGEINGNSAAASE